MEPSTAPVAGYSGLSAAHPDDDAWDVDDDNIERTTSAFRSFLASA